MNNNFSFEKSVLRQEAYWVHELSAKFKEKQVKLVLVANPETQEIDGTILFKDCANLEQKHFGNDNILPSLLGIQNVENNSSTNYIITTELSEVSFTTNSEPEVIWVDPSKQKQKWKSEQLKI